MCFNLINLQKRGDILYTQNMYNRKYDPFTLIRIVKEKLRDSDSSFHSGTALVCR